MLQERISEKGDTDKIGIPTPRKLVQPLSSSMLPPPPPRMMPPPPPPPKFQSSSQKVHDNNMVNKAPSKIVPGICHHSSFFSQDFNKLLLGLSISDCLPILITPFFLAFLVTKWKCENPLSPINIVELILLFIFIFHFLFLYYISMK